MENLDKNFDVKVMKEFRKELHCKKCDVFPGGIFPRSDVKLMRCGSCTKLLCSKCSETKEGVFGENKCPLCQYKSNNPKIPTFIQQSELMKVILGYKTHPCGNVKNGCHEEIPANLDDLKSHAKSCVFQMVPCPKMNCKETFIFKYLVDCHLKPVHHLSPNISIYYGTEKYPNTYGSRSDFYGVYNKQDEPINCENYYEMGDLGIWFSESTGARDRWIIGNSSEKGQNRGFASVKGFPFLDDTTSWEWKWSLGWTKFDWKDANQSIGVKELSFDSTKEWNFEGTKEELLSSFCCLNAYDRQFYPQFKEVNGCLIFRTLMLGFQEETIPFEFSITFFHKNDKPLVTNGGMVYPITKEKDTIFETSAQYHLNVLTEYYDTETGEFKKQSKIIFSMKIISPKLDEIAKDQNIESGIEDSDVEKDEKDSVNGE